LETHVDFIRQQRRQRKTWQEIAAQLRTEKGCDITFQGLHQFYRRYLKRRSQPHWEDMRLESSPAALRPTASNRDPIVAATPVARSFRQPNPNNINLNDPTNI
jgi:hypothetical protein